MKTNLDWNEEALEFVGYTYEEILAVCESVKEGIIAGYEEGLYEESTVEEYAQTLFDAVQRLAD